MKYGDISLVLCISTRLRLVTIPLVKDLVILHADPCNKSDISYERAETHWKKCALALQVAHLTRVSRGAAVLMTILYMYDLASEARC